MYRVLNDNNAYVKVTDDDIENVLKENMPLNRAIIIAMGKTHKMEYLTQLYPYLNDERFYIRRDTSQSIFLISGEKGLEKLKEREQLLDESDFKLEPSEKALLQAMIIRIEKGVDGAEEYFFSAQGNEIVKSVQIAYYIKGYLYGVEDIGFIIKVINAYVEKTMLWIEKMSKSECKEAIVFAIQSIWYANNESNLLRQIEDNLCHQLYVTFQKTLEIKLDSDGMEMIVDIAMGMREEYAVKILKLLNGKVRGDAKKAHKKAMKELNLGEIL